MDEQTLRQYFVTAEARDLYHALPSHIAAHLQLPTHTILESLVVAMFNGEAVLHWELECPVCHAFGEIPNLLQNPLHEHVCMGCGSTFTVHVDHEAQITFSPHPIFRELGPDADDAEYRKSLRQRFPPTTVNELMAVQRFRDWAQNEPLPSGEYLEVRSTTIWFSDLTGSTVLYARNGDPFAYHLVREHFDIVGQAIQEAEGALVKTIGDGVMAVFLTGVQALRASLAANEQLEVFNAENQLDGERCLRLKIGIHTGPAIVVTLNDRLDYFGTTVNMAARVSSLAQGGQILMTEAAYAHSGVASIAKSYPLVPFDSYVRGLDDPVKGYCICLNNTTIPEKPSRKGLLGFFDRLGKRV